ARAVMPSKGASVAVGNGRNSNRLSSGSAVDENGQKVSVKVEEPDEFDDADTSADFKFTVPSVPHKRAQKRRLSTDSPALESTPVRRALAVSRNDSNSPIATRNGATPDNRRRSGSVFSRAGSVFSNAGSVNSFGDPNDVDGKVKGAPMSFNDRQLLELASCIIYPFPRYTNFTDVSLRSRVCIGKRLSKMKGLLLDLNQPGEIDGVDGESEPGRDYTVDSFIAVDNLAVLLNWEGFKYPTWQDKRLFEHGPAFIEYNRRIKMLDHVMGWFMINMTYGEMRKNYPYLTISQTVDYGVYVKHPGIVYLSGLRKRERQINDFLDTAYNRDSDKHGPTLIFEDNTNFQGSSIPAYEHILDNQLTDAAKKIEDDLLVVETNCNCTKNCDTRTCDCANKTESNLAYIRKRTVGNTAPVHGDGPKGNKEVSSDFVDAYECGSACSCSIDKCTQRVIQRGRQVRLIVFRHHEKGWILRTAENIKAGTFVCEYTGVMMTTKEAAAKTDPTYQLEVEVKTKSGRNHTLVLDARLKGSEARFVSHSCDANLFSFRVHYDITGRSKRHIGMYASRDIAAGEELTFDYYPNYVKPADFVSKVKFQCSCNAETCRYKAWKKETAAARRASMKMEEEE
ncbi:hypothetical protein PFISCL1PPCAC_13310, partial [Pristionchus fissidentatus]